MYYIDVPLPNVPISLLAGWVVLTTPLGNLNHKISPTLTLILCIKERNKILKSNGFERTSFNVFMFKISRSVHEKLN